MTIEWVMGIAGLAGLIGLGLGILLPIGRNAQKTRVVELETQLADSQSELAEYRSEVYGQFAQTADKFRKLDESYQDLHRQLANSAVALCGDQANPLLISGAGTQALAGADSENVDEAGDPLEEVVEDAVAGHALEADAVASASDVVLDNLQPSGEDSEDSEDSANSTDNAEQATDTDLAAAVSAEALDNTQDNAPVAEHAASDEAGLETGEPDAVAVTIPTITDALLEEERREEEKEEFQAGSQDDLGEDSERNAKETGEFKQSA